MQFKVGLKTDVGMKRQQNQDSSGAFTELGLFIVSDGMGGHRGGEIASATAVDTIYRSVHSGVLADNWASDLTIEKAIEAANAVIYEKSKIDPSLSGMGTTTTALLFQNNGLSIGHVGDSRCYLIRPNALWQVTRDHSLVQEKIRAGLITREEARTDRMKNVITRSVGFESGVQVEIYQMLVQSGDCFLMCSDGLSGLMEESEMLSTVQTHLFEKKNIQKAAEELTAKANANGGDDNITAILIQVL